MTNNPYAPPTTFVADVAIQPRPTEVHGNVAFSCKLLWWSFGISMVGFVLQLFMLPMGGVFLGALIGAGIGGAIGLGITYWLTLKLTAGRNWMRLLITVSTLLWIAFIPLLWSFDRQALSNAFAPNLAQGAITGIQLILSVTVVVLINSAGARSWFYAMKHGA